jgi:hypothetical protein
MVLSAYTFSLGVVERDLAVLLVEAPEDSRAKFKQTAYDVVGELLAVPAFLSRYASQPNLVGTHRGVLHALRTEPENVGLEQRRALYEFVRSLNQIAHEQVRSAYRPPF